MSFSHLKVFLAARSLPLGLATGDIAVNLRQLAAGPVPAEPVARQLFQLLSTGHPLHELEEVVSVIRDLPHSTRGVEQAHASAAMVHRHRPAFQSDMLACRSMMNAMRPLVSPREAATRTERLERRITRLMTYQPRSCTGRQLFLKDSMPTAAGLHPGGMLPQSTKVDIMRQRSKEFAALDQHARVQYEAFARDLGQQRDQQRQSDIMEAQTQLNLLARREAEDIERCSPFCFQARRLPEADKHKFEQLYNSDGFSHKRVEQLRDAAAIAPPLADMFYKLQLRPHAEPQPPPAATPPPWLGEVCAQRDQFVQCGLVFAPPSGSPAFFAFCFAYENTYLLALARLRSRAFEQDLAASAARDELWGFDWDMQHIYVYSTEDMRDWALEHMSVIPHVRFLPAGRVVSHANAVLLSEYLEALPPLQRKAAAPTAGEGAAHAPTGGTAACQLFAERSCALQHLDAGAEMLKRRKRSPAEGGSEDEDELDARGLPCE